MSALNSTALLRLQLVNGTRVLGELRRINSALTQAQQKAQSIGSGGRSGGRGRSLLEPIGGVEGAPSLLTTSITGFRAVQQGIAAGQVAAKQALSVRATADAFEALAGSQEEAVARTKAMNAAIDGQVPILVQQQGLLRLQGAGLDVTAAQFGALADNVLHLAAVYGVDASNAIERITKGITKLESEFVDELQLFPNLTQAVSDYARETGKATSEVTKQEKQMLLLNQITEQAEQQSNALGGELDEMVKSFNRGQAAIQNFKDDLARLGPTAASSATAFGTAFGDVLRDSFSFSVPSAIAAAMQVAAKQGGSFLRYLPSILGRLFLGSAVAATGFGAIAAVGSTALTLAPSVIGSFTKPEINTTIEVPLRDSDVRQAAAEAGRATEAAIIRRLEDMNASFRESQAQQTQSLLSSRGLRR